MTAVSELSELISHLNPVLLHDDYVFCCVGPEQAETCLALPPLSTFQENEGLSVIVTRAQADALGLEYESVHQCITFQVHSSLTAVGLTAAVSAVLANEGLSANVVAGYHHDHVFVPAESASMALDLIQKLSRSQSVNQ